MGFRLFELLEGELEFPAIPFVREGFADELGILDLADLAKFTAVKRRFIPMNDTLAAWLSVYPFAPCPNWADKDKAVRRLAGWEVEARLIDDPPEPNRGPWPKNVIRHTHASVEIANGASLEDLLFRFGHNEDPKTLRSHYVGRMRKKDAVEILSIGPRGSTVPLLKSA